MLYKREKEWKKSGKSGEEMKHNKIDDYDTKNYFLWVAIKSENRH